MNQQVIYFDNAATTRVLAEVAELMFHSHLNNFGNPSSPHEVGRHARAAVEQSRRSIASLLNTQPGEIFFTSGGTEANNAILLGCIKYHGRKHIITSRLEHPSVLQTILYLQKKSDCTCHFVKTDAKGVVDLGHLEQLLAANPGAMVSLMHANNELGNLLPLKVVGGLCQQYKAFFHSDTVQTIGKVLLDLKEIPLDFAALSAHKFHGPKGVGAMFIRAGKVFLPFMQGGAQERNMRPGTENVQGIMGMAKALELVHWDMDAVTLNITAIKNFLIKALSESIPGIVFNGDIFGDALPTILNISLPLGIDAGLLLPRLDLEGICVSTGSACSSGSSKQSQVLAALGADPKIPNLRISISRFNTPEEAKLLIKALTKICNSP